MEISTQQFFPNYSDFFFLESKGNVSKVYHTLPFSWYLHRTCWQQQATPTLQGLLCQFGLRSLSKKPITLCEFIPNRALSGERDNPWDPQVPLAPHFITSYSAMGHSSAPPEDTSAAAQRSVLSRSLKHQCPSHHSALG